MHRFFKRNCLALVGSPVLLLSLILQPLSSELVAETHSSDAEAMPSQSSVSDRAEIEGRITDALSQNELFNTVLVGWLIGLPSLGAYTVVNTMPNASAASALPELAFMLGVGTAAATAGVTIKLFQKAAARYIDQLPVSETVFVDGRISGGWVFAETQQHRLVTRIQVSASENSTNDFNETYLVALGESLDQYKKARDKILEQHKLLMAQIKGKPISLSRFIEARFAIMHLESQLMALDEAFDNLFEAVFLGGTEAILSALPPDIREPIGIAFRPSTSKAQQDAALRAVLRACSKGSK
ncbi:MAG: hypothetical protein EA369_04325 [Bradymonadales bacterium]|nr:MAG: hypothetical protein EA369_04325 [Bradymonadales bacterium]